MKNLILSTFMLAGLAMSVTTNAADTFPACKNKEGKKLEKCQKKKQKALDKKRKKTTPFQPSKIHADFAHLDGADVNPFNSDHHYYGVKEAPTEAVAEIVEEVDRAVGVVKMTAYIGALHKTDKEQATKLAKVVLPEIMGLKDSINDIMEKVNKALENVEEYTSSASKSSPEGGGGIVEASASVKVEASANPLEVARIMGTLTSSAGRLTATVTELPLVLAAIVPIAKGAAADGVDALKDAAQDAVKDAVPAGVGDIIGTGD